MSELHDFGDWRGSYPAHKHANGGGWVADTAIVPNGVMIPSSAQVGNYAKVADDFADHFCGAHFALRLRAQESVAQRG